MPEPSTSEGVRELFQGLEQMRSFNAKGPLVKLMRWFSFFESNVFYQGDLWATKMILEDKSLDMQADQDEEAAFIALPQQSKDARQELNSLKAENGKWKLAQMLINHKKVNKFAGHLKHCIDLFNKMT